MSKTIFEKIQDVRVELRNAKLRMTGKNAFAKYDYFELDDFLPTLEVLMQKHKMTAIPSFTRELATLTAYNCEEPFDKVEITSPFGTADLKGCYEVQSIGAVETYQRRYLYQALFDIGEKDCLNATSNKDESSDVGVQEQKTYTESKAPKSLQKSMNLQEALNYTINFGAHKGKPFSQIPQDYLKWLRDNARDEKTRNYAEMVIEYMDTSKQASVFDDDGFIPF